jgi:hypothetical protein
MTGSQASSFEDGAEYTDRHGDTWRAVAEGTEFQHVRRADEETADRSVSRWCESADSIARDFGPMTQSP